MELEVYIYIYGKISKVSIRIKEDIYTCTKKSFRKSQTVIICPRINLMKYLLFPPHRFSRDKVGTRRSFVRRASAARAILLANAASLYSSQQAVHAVESKFVAKSGERDGSGASSGTPTAVTSTVFVS